MDQATNAAIMRARNRKLILNMIRMQPISRAGLADAVQLTRASITQIVDELIENGLVEPVDSAATVSSNTLGRKRTQLALCRKSRFVFGVHINRRVCHVGAVDLCGELQVEQCVSVAGRAASNVLNDIAACIHQQRTQLQLHDTQIIGVGVCTPGPIKYRAGTLCNPPNFAAWHGVPVCEVLQNKTGLTVLLEKDTNARALEEKYYGAAQQLSDFMLVQIDDGVGSGVIVRNALYRGNDGLGSEIGHTSICYNGPQCSCGNRGCLENYLRIPSLLADTPYRTWAELAEHEAEPTAAEVLDRAADYAATALINAVNLYDLEKVLLSGVVAEVPEPLLRRLNNRMSSCVLSKSTKSEELVSTATAPVPVRTGAMAMLHAFFQERE